MTMVWTPASGADFLEAPPAQDKLNCDVSVPAAMSDELYAAAKSLTASDAFWGVERNDPRWEGSALWGPKDRTIIAPQISFYPSKTNGTDADGQSTLGYQINTVFPVHAHE